MARSHDNRMLFGVCAGIAKQLGIRSVWVRVFFMIAAAVVPGVSLLMVVALYGALALILPWDDEVKSIRY